MKNNILLFFILIYYLCSCNDTKELNFSNHYPKEITGNEMKNIYSQIKWSYYKYYQDCQVLTVDISKEGLTDTLSSIPLFYHKITEIIRIDSNEYSISFYVKDFEKITLNAYITPEYDCFNKSMGSPLYTFFIKKTTNNLCKIEYIEQVFIEDMTWINKILHSPDAPFVEKLLAHQDSITPWLKNELILRGYLKE